MRTIIFTGLVVLALLIALPAAVSAAGSDTVTVSGSIGGYIDVDVAASALDLGTMTVGGSNIADTTLTVDSSYNAWGVDVSASNGGYMQATTGPLDTLFDISNDEGATYHQLSSTWVDFFSGTASIDQMETVDVHQTVTTNDPSGSYSITITFTGGSN